MRVHPPSAGPTEHTASKRWSPNGALRKRCHRHAYPSGSASTFSVCTDRNGKLCAGVMSTTPMRGQVPLEHPCGSDIQIEGRHFILNRDDSAPAVGSSKEAYKFTWP